MTARSFPLYVVLVLVAWLVNWPGRLYPDSEDMLLQARDISSLNDWHPPVVTWLWSLPTPMLGQPAGALLVQVLLLFAYPAMVLLTPAQKHWDARNLVHTVGWSLLLLALIAAAGNILKDLTLLGFILCFLATIHVLAVRSLRTTRAVVLCITFAVLILVVRPTDFVILGFAAACWVMFNLRDRRTKISAFAAIVFGCLVALPLTHFINRTIVGSQDALTERSLMIFDVAGISSSIQQDLFAELRDWPANQVQRPWDCYTPAAWDPFAWGQCNQYSNLVADTIKQDGKGEVFRWWSRAVLSHPIAYLQHRLSYTLALLGREGPIVDPTRTPYAINTATSELADRGFQIWKPVVAYSAFTIAVDIVFSRLAFFLWLLACVGLLSYTWRCRHAGSRIDTVVLIAAAIGVGNILMLIPFGVAADGRYLLPTVVCGMVGVLRLTAVGSKKEAQPCPSPDISRLSNA